MSLKSFSGRFLSASRSCCIPYSRTAKRTFLKFSGVPESRPPNRIYGVWRVINWTVQPASRRKVKVNMFFQKLFDMCAYEIQLNMWRWRVKIKSKKWKEERKWHTRLKFQPATVQYSTIQTTVYHDLSSAPQTSCYTILLRRSLLTNQCSFDTLYQYFPCNLL